MADGVMVAWGIFFTLLTVANLAILALNLKLYTEWWKERVKR